jgi:hypothetical protein
MKPEADRGTAPRSALSTSRTSWWSVRWLRHPGERPLRTDCRERPRSQRWQGCLRLHRRCIATVERAGRSGSPSGSPGSPLESPGKLRGKSDHGEDTSPWKERATCHSQGCRAQRTRSQRNASKSRISPDTPLLPPTSNGEQTERTSRVRPNGTEEAGRGDAVRLRTGGTLRRVDGVARSEARISPRHGCRPPSGGQHLVIQGERVSAKRGEPHDRQRDATSPQTFARRKPSRWCKTTRAERGWTGGAVGPKGAPGQPGASGKWTREVMSVEGQSGHEPQERQGPWRPVRRFGFWSAPPRGPGCRADAS